jgi:hypothetical protein
MHADATFSILPELAVVRTYLPLYDQNRTHYNIRERESSQHKKTRNILVSFVDPRDKASVKALLKTCKGKANALDFGRRKDKSALCECGRPHKQSWAIRRRMDSLK